MNRKVITMMVASFMPLGGLCFPAAYAAGIDSGTISAAQKSNFEENAETSAATSAGTNPQKPEQELPDDGQGGPSESTASASATNLPDEDCVCKSLCVEDSVNKDCLICGSDFTLCGFEAWDTKRLYFYYYKKTSNSYTRIVNPAYLIDANGYLRFQTGYAGEIIVSERLLERK